MRRVLLGDVARVEISGVDKKINSGEQPVRLCNFTDVYKNWAITEKMYSGLMVASASQKEISKFVLRRGQVAVTKDSETRDDIGIPAYIADDFDDVLLGYHCALITPDESQLNGKYLNAFLHTNYIQKFFSANASGSGQRYTLSVETLNSIPLFLPDIDEQRRIGELFSNLDRKITLSRRTNEDLEEMARQLYDYWFVQFDFPDENGRPYRAAGGVLTWNSSLKRDIPSGWDVASLDTLCDRIQSGGTPVTSNRSYYQGDNAWYSTQELTDKWLVDSIKHISDDAIENSAAKLFAANTVVIAIYASPTVGRLGLLSEVGSFNQACCGLVVGSRISKEYLFMTLKACRKQLNTLADGTAQKNLNVGKIKDFKILVPEQRVMLLWSERMEPLFSLLLNHEKEIKDLTKQRDSLIPLLMNGQVSL